MLDTIAANTAIGKASIITQIFIVAGNSGFRSIWGWWDDLTAVQWAAVIAALILCFGAVIEYWAKLKLLILLLGKLIFFRSTPFERCALKKIASHSLGPLLVVAGIAGEVLFEGQTFILEHRQETKSQETISSLQREASSNERAADQLRKDAEGLKKDAEDERLSRAKIEAAVAWRSLDDKQKQEIGTALGSFGPKAGASIWYDASSTEAQMFADDIAEALRSGHITTTNVGGIISAAEGGKWNGSIVRGQTGVIIQSTNNPAAIEFALAVVKELSSRGFDATRQKDPPFEKGSEPVIWINVEGRPKGPQGEYKLQAEREAKTKKQTNSK